MPTKRTHTTRGRAVLTLQAIGLHDVLSLSSGWSPPDNDFARSRTRWETWEQFCEEYAELRDEYLASGWSKRHDGRLPFAEWVYREYHGAPPPPWEQQLEGDSRYPAIKGQPRICRRYREEA